MYQIEVSPQDTDTALLLGNNCPGPLLQCRCPGNESIYSVAISSICDLTTIEISLLQSATWSSTWIQQMQNGGFHIFGHLVNRNNLTVYTGPNGFTLSSTTVLDNMCTSTPSPQRAPLYVQTHTICSTNKSTYYDTIINTI